MSDQAFRQELETRMVGAMTGMRIFGCAGALMVLVAASGASAQEGEVVKSILGSIGIIPKEKPPIIYNERAPLVLPPSLDKLPPPAPGGGPEARNANWPKDPDVIAARKAAQEARTPYTETEYYKTVNGKPLSIDEIRAGRNPNNYNTAPVQERKDTRLSPDELRAFSQKDKDIQLEGDGLERRYLSDPPEALLKAAAGAPLKASADPLPEADQDSPYAFIRQQQKQR
jgi:hypothetical protein